MACRRRRERIASPAHFCSPAAPSWDSLPTLAAWIMTAGIFTRAQCSPTAGSALSPWQLSPALALSVALSHVSRAGCRAGSAAFGVGSPGLSLMSSLSSQDTSLVPAAGSRAVAARLHSRELCCRASPVTHWLLGW